MSPLDKSWSTSPSLIQRIQAHDEEAWRRFCDIYTALVYDWISKSGVPPVDAEDVTQETLRGVFNGIDQFRHDRAEDTFRGWLLTVTRREIMAWHRRAQETLAQGEGGTEANSRLRHLPDWVESDSDCQELLNDPATEKELIRRAAETVEQDFETHTWQSFWRTTVDGEAVVDVAEDLKMTPNAVRQARFQVLARLRQVLE